MASLISNSMNPNKRKTSIILISVSTLDGPDFNDSNTNICMSLYGNCFQAPIRIE